MKKISVTENEILTPIEKYYIYYLTGRKTARDFIDYVLRTQPEFKVSPGSYGGSAGMYVYVNDKPLVYFDESYSKYILEKILPQLDINYDLVDDLVDEIKSKKQKTQTQTNSEQRIEDEKYLANSVTKHYRFLKKFKGAQDFEVTSLRNMYLQGFATEPENLEYYEQDFIDELIEDNENTPATSKIKNAIIGFIDNASAFIQNKIGQENFSPQSIFTRIDDDINDDIDSEIMNAEIIDDNENIQSLPEKTSFITKIFLKTSSVLDNNGFYRMSDDFFQKIIRKQNNLKRNKYYGNF